MLSKCLLPNSDSFGDILVIFSQRMTHSLTNKSVDHKAVCRSAREIYFRLFNQVFWKNICKKERQNKCCSVSNVSLKL